MITLLILFQLKRKIDNSNTLKILQEQFLGLKINNNSSHIYENINITEDNNMEFFNDESYEIEIILDHKGIIVEDSYYFVKWKNYPSDQNSWIHYNNFNTFDLINSYWTNKTN